MTDTLARKRTAAVEMAREYRRLNGDPIDNIETLLTEIDYHDAVPEFDHPRTQADRVVLALRYPSAPVLGQSPSHAVPIGAVRKEIAGRVYLLAVYDADILAALVRMGWEEVAS